MARRGTRVTRKSGTTVWGGDWCTVPSGVSVDGNAGTITTKSGGTITGGGDVKVTAKIDLGQGTFYKVYRGVAPLSNNAPTNGTRLSNGTVQFLTGLSTISHFSWALDCSSVSPGRREYPREIHFTTGYQTAGGVTMFLSSSVDGVAWTGCTPAGINQLGGSTIHWVAMGT